ncbi:hypothetical protein [Candidatus Entotheonella palauensis]|uniref:hypothetical protein n=1 Tax=Candidatus Entotheonella palauensis TaxID=93172 RepID=UPI0021199F24|nr:hypothetical protein [Candidatus Entotheonella palauensis]
MKNIIFIGIAFGFTLMATIAHAQNATYRSFIENLLESNIKVWIQEPTVIESIKAQNTKNAELTQNKIQDLDKQWRAERKASQQPLIDNVLANPLSKFLQEVKEQNGELFSEVFIMDNKGLNVGQSDITSDYWQGDEAKWQQTYLAGPGSVLIGDREFDDSSGKFLIQVSVTVVDPDSQQAIGAATVGVNLVQLMRISTAAATSQ